MGRCSGDIERLIRPFEYANPGVPAQVLDPAVYDVGLARNARPS